MSKIRNSIVTKKIVLLPVLALATVLLGGCVFNSREITVYKGLPHTRRDYFRNEILNPDGLSFESENFINGNLLQGKFRNDPDAVLKKLDEFYAMTRDAKYLRIASDVCRAKAISTGNEEEALQYHLSSYHYCRLSTELHRKTSNTSSDIRYDYALTQLAQNYNDACCGIFSYLKSHNLLNSDSVVLNARADKSFVLEKSIYCLSVPKDTITDFSLCSDYKVQNLMQVSRRPGLGVPLVAKMNQKQLYKSLKTPEGLTIPVTLLFRPCERPDGRQGLQLIYQDTTLAEERTTDKSDKIMLALDFSTPLACLLDSLPNRNLISVMLNPLDYEGAKGLYMLEPYQPGKIPVVFIHGLMSSPGTWMQMFNFLKNDPEIRKNYQFWFYFYSSGAPVLFSASGLRDALYAAEKEFTRTPQEKKAFNRMVLVGHSMGGMITRTLLQKNPYHFLENTLHRPWSEIQKKLQPEDLKLMEKYAVYHPLPFVHRAIFMAVPHRGAKMAQSFIAQFGASITKLPSLFLKGRELSDRVKKALNLKKSPFSIASNRDFFTGIDNLDPDSLYVRNLSSSAMKDDLTYHCIIGNVKQAGVPGGSDGVVPYSSSHLNDTASELVVKSDHSVQRRPEAIREVNRLLLLHLKESR